jgi:glycosyltransferase involved in cell wall biosynthesis
LPRPKILFTSTLSNPFVLEDLRLLRKFHDVDAFISSGIAVPFRLVYRVLRADVTYTWFASVYSFFVVFLARLFRKKSIIVVGGVDVARVPEFNYGIWLNPWKSRLVGYALRNASRVLVVDPSLQRAAMLHAKYPGDNITCVPTGYDPELWHFSGTKERFVLTIAGCNDERRLGIKGINVLLDAARHFIDLQFVIIGIGLDLQHRLRQSAPGNVLLLAPLGHDALLSYYQRAAVYCQPSFLEGLPNSVCEAMLCECIPVGSDRGGIPNAIDGAGFVVPYGDAAQLAEAIRKALDVPSDAGKKAREYIATTFPLARREVSLHQVIESL